MGGECYHYVNFQRSAGEPSEAAKNIYAQVVLPQLREAVNQWWTRFREASNDNELESWNVNMEPTSNAFRIVYTGIVSSSTILHCTRL